MPTVFTYSGVITKLRAMYSRLLTFEDYEIIISKHTVSEVVLWLKESEGYGSIFDNINESSVHRGDIESVFDKAIYEDAESLSKMLGKKEKMMMDVFLSRQEIEVLKKIVRGILTGIKPKSDSLYKHHSWFQSENMRDLYDKLSDTEYGKLFKTFIDKELESTFVVERMLDEFYFERLKDAAYKYMTKSDTRHIVDFISAEVDVYNILSAYRYRKYYDFDKNEVLFNMLPNKYKLKKSDLDNIAEADKNNFVSAIAKTGYRGLFVQKSDKEWDISSQDFLCKLYKKQLRENAYSFTTILAYLYLKELDIKNIITIIEGVRYGLDPSVIRTYLVEIK